MKDNLKIIAKIVLVLVLLFVVPYILDNCLIQFNNSHLFTPLNKSQVQLDLAKAINKLHFLLTTYLYNILIGVLDVLGVTFLTLWFTKDILDGMKNRFIAGIVIFSISGYLNFSPVYSIYMATKDIIIPVLPVK